MILTRQNIQAAIESVATFSTSSWAREDHLHREVNQNLLEHGLNTLSLDELAGFIEARGYRRFYDACGRTIWRGIGLQTNRDTVIASTVEDEYPTRFTMTHLLNESMTTNPLELGRCFMEENEDDEMDF